MSARPRIVVGVDGTPASRAALRWALAHARTTGAHVDTVLAWDHPHLSVAGAVHPMLAASDTEQEAHQRLAAVLDDAGVGPSCPDGMPVGATAVLGSPADVLVAEAYHAQLLVLGAHRRNLRSPAPIGAVAGRCLAGAPCPVVVVPAT
jgi:nucleotide-binding universal stress UspA family protein